MISSDEYIELAKELITKPIIYVEGQSNKIFYQNIEELYDKFVTNGFSSNNIIKLVSENDKRFGIIDHDYMDITVDRIFQIDFYSIENISLINLSELHPLREKLTEYLNSNNLNNVKTCKQQLIVETETIDSHRIDNYYITSSDEHHIQYHLYINKRISCINTFLKYKDLKKVVERYVKIHKSLHPNNKKIHHLTKLIDQLPSKSICLLFDSYNYQKFNQYFA